MSGEEISEENIDAAVNEIVTTGNLETETGSTDEIEGMVAYLKGQVAGKDLSSDEIQGEIAEAAKKFHITLTETQRDDLTKLMTKIQGLDLNMDSLKNQAQSVYDKLKDIGANVDVDALTEQAQGFFEKIIAFFKKLFGKL